MDKLEFKSISELIKYLYHNRKTNMEIFKKQKDELRQIKLLYHELKSNEIFNIIQQISPIINIYFISFANKINKYTLTFDIFMKIFTEFDLYPNIIGYNVLKNIFYEIYQIRKRKIKSKEENNLKLLEEIKEIGYDEILMAIGVISLYLKNMSSLDEKQIIFGIFYKIAESKKIKLEINLNFNFSDSLKNKLVEISNLFFDNSNSEVPEYKSFLENPFL